jgi:hypothetical protein
VCPFQALNNTANASYAPADNAACCLVFVRGDSATKISADKLTNSIAMSCMMSALLTHSTLYLIALVFNSQHLRFYADSGLSSTPTTLSQITLLPDLNCKES